MLERRRRHQRQDKALPHRHTEEWSILSDKVQIFEEIVARLPRNKARLLADHAVLLNPDAPLQGDWQKTPYLAAILALTHGNETIGIDVVIDLLRNFASGLLAFELPFLVVLSNLEAYKKDLRFVEYDINRLYGKKADPTCYEMSRNKEIAALLDQVAFTLDIHQTQLPLAIAKPFWPALEQEKVIQAIKEIDRHAIIVKTPAKAPSELDQGVSCDNYMHFKGRIGVTIELGSRGFDVYQKALGLEICGNFLEFARQRYLGEKQPLSFQGQEFHTFRQIFAAKGLRLDESLRTFKKIGKGETFGTYGDGSPLVADCDCYALFPKVSGLVKKDERDPICYLMRE